ncbi:class II aaRS and biotin synthetase [Boletus reticuloceps]|uniref:Class II aaRS and biotin synthetase n=1 Tax=Boletus reticuloceps TaxID=495285 RepID=A0A8I3AEB1_9AGAM|nr:class II aaRS and biotin synthetase [Boletus reticuloceps]
MNVLVYPSTHPHASTVQRHLSSILVPHYLPQIISPDVLAAPENPWQTACGLLVLLAAPDHHAGIRQYAETRGKILALGVNASKSQGLHETASSFGLGVLRDTSILRLVDGKASLHLSFPSQATTPATVNHSECETAITRIPSASLDLGSGVRVLGRYADDKTLAGALSENGTIALWSCAPPLPEQLLIPTLSALGLRIDLLKSTESQQPGFSLLPQLLLAHPKKWDIQRRVVHTLFPDRNLEMDGTHKVIPSESAVFPDEHDNFRFHFVHEIPTSDLPSDHPILTLLSGVPKEEVKDVILAAQLLTAEQEKYYTPRFSPSTFFSALDEFRPTSKADELLMGDVLLYGEVVTSTQTMLDKNPKLLRTLPSPLLSLATKQVAGRGRGKNAWLSPAGSMLASLKLSIPLKSVDSGYDSRSIRPSNLVFIQYLFALAVVEACQALDPANKWAPKVKLKWPNDIYGEFPAEETWKNVELKKLGGILVNTSFRGNTVDVIIGMYRSSVSYLHLRVDPGCGLNVLNEPPISSLAQLEALTRGQGVASSLSVEQVTAAVFTTFERIWNSFLAEESEGFRPFMERYTSQWLHSGQTVTLTTIFPSHHGSHGGHHARLRAFAFDMMKGLIKTKTS